MDNKPSQFSSVLPNAMHTGHSAEDRLLVDDFIIRNVGMCDSDVGRCDEDSMMPTWCEHDASMHAQ